MSRRYRKHPQTAGRIVDGLAFVVTGDDQKLHSLNATATHLWELCGGGCSVEEGARALAERFEVELDTAIADARECLDDLVARRILIVEP